MKKESAKKPFTVKTLSNGLRVVTIPMKSPTVTALVLVEAGSKYENKKNNGISHFLEHMCFKGTTKRATPTAIARELDTLGTQYNAFTGQEYTGYYAKGKSTHASKLVEIVSDLYLNPTLPKEEIEKEKGVICDEINMYEDMPARKVYDTFQALLFGDQPAGWNIAGTKDLVRSFTRNDFVKYRQANYVAQATTVVVSGDIDEAQIQKEIAAQFKSAPTNKKATKLKAKANQKAPEIKLEYKKTDQSHILLGFRAFDTYNKKNTSATLLAGILGAGMSSRLFSKIRDEMGCGYYVGAHNETMTDSGVMLLRAGVAPERALEVVSALLAECKKLKDTLVSEEELEKVKEILAGNMSMGLEATDAVAEFYGEQAILRKDLKTREEIEAEYRKVTSKDIQNIAKELFVVKGLNLAVLGPHKNEKEFKKILASFS